MKKIAPMLHHHVSMPPTKTYFTVEDMKQGQAELRALLAVAKQARSLHIDMGLPDDAPLGRALARLDKVSAGTDEGGTGGRT